MSIYLDFQCHYIQGIEKIKGNLVMILDSSILLTEQELSDTKVLQETA